MANDKVDMIAKILLIIGGLNWGLVAIGAQFELVQYLQIGWLIRTVYALVGIAGIMALVKLVKK